MPQINATSAALATLSNLQTLRRTLNPPLNNPAPARRRLKIGFIDRLGQARENSYNDRQSAI
jgi:hypothetical protein